MECKVIENCIMHPMAKATLVTCYWFQIVSPRRLKYSGLLDLFFVICFCHHYIWLQDKDLKLCMKGHCWRSFAVHKTDGGFWFTVCHFFFFFENRLLFPFVLIAKFLHFVSWYPHHHCDLHCYHISNVFNQYRSRKVECCIPLIVRLLFAPGALVLAKKPYCWLTWSGDLSWLVKDLNSPCCVIYQ